MSGKDGETPPPRPGNTVDSRDDADGAAAFDLSRIGQRIAELSREMADLTRLAGEAAPRKLESEAAAAAFRALAEAYAHRPDALQAAQTDLFAKQSDAMQQMAMGMPGADDARFSDPSWTENPFYDFMRRTFLASTAWAEQLAWNAPDLSETERRRAAFFIRQAAASMSPANTLVGNPRALKAMFDTDGQSIQRGMANLQADYAAGEGRLSVTQTDTSAFELGRDLAVTPGEIVLTNPLIELIRYHPTQEQVRERPVLIFPPWINKYYVLDLTPANSLVAWLRDQGFTVYMVSWRSADAETREFGWDDYVTLGGRAALDYVHGAHDAPVNAAGYCVGGALLSVLAAKLAQADDTRLSSITLLAAQTDFSEPGDLGLFIDNASMPGIADLIVQHDGVMPGEAMRDAFNLLRPEDLIWRYVEERYLLGEAPRAFDLLYWNSDQTNLPGPLHMQSLQRLYLDNALATGAFEIEGAAVSLTDIVIPVFIHAARRDHISPFASVYKGAQLFGGDTTFILADSGHIAGVVNPPAANKYRYWTGEDHPPASDDWMYAAQEHAGSWWPLWAEWLHEKSGAWTNPPAPMEQATPAPGRYVRERLGEIRARMRAAE